MESCPKCGYCPKCGRGNAPYHPYYPPYHPYRYQYPYWNSTPGIQYNQTISALNATSAKPLYSNVSVSAN